MSTPCEQTVAITPKVANRNLDIVERVRTLRRALWARERRSPLYFTFSSLAVAFAQMLGGIIVVRYVLPQELGLWQTANLAVTYSFFLLAGVHNGLSRELPFSLGADDSKTASKLTGTSLLYTSAGCLTALLGGIGTAVYLVIKHVGTEAVLAVIAVTLLIIFGFYRNYLVVTFRSKSSFFDLAHVQTKEACLYLATIPLLYYLHYSGMLLRLVLVTLIGSWLMYRVRPMKVPLSWDTQSFKVLLGTGMPIFVMDYIRSCASTFDRVALLHFGGVKAVGYYSLALSTYSAFEVIPVSIAHYIYPRMSYEYGREKNGKVLWHLAWKVTLVLIAIMIPLAIAGWFVLPPIIKALFPHYVEGTRAVQVMLLCGICAGAAVGVNALWSMKAWKGMVAYQGIFSVCLVVCPFVGARLFASPMTGVACGMLVARLLSAIAGTVITYAATHGLWGDDRTDVA